MKIEVRLAEPGDAAAIAETHIEAWRAAYRHVVPSSFLDDPAFAESRRTGWHRRLVDGVVPEGWDRDDRLFAGLVDGDVVGFGHVGEARSDDPADAERVPGAGAGSSVGELYGFYVHPDAWGSGVADEIIESCHVALAERFDVAVLWVLTDNPRARRFYERSGWRCDVGDGEAVTALWPGPSMPGSPTLDTPLHETRYHRRVR